ncbi:sensor histidine kinase [Hymenobacter sp. CRA2]|uniref:sensor histidine kinase n=1 Tax=Hymenobacter sp. CRA2 TaxID=1955620 RepID=UPI00158FBE00|nr:sensor histidine kinase [Hymenobacter sp. CRA2]
MLLAWLALPTAAQNLTFRTLSTQHGLSESSVYSLVQDRNGFLWLGTQDGLNRYDGAAFRVFRSDPQQPTALVSSFILSLAADAKGGLWVGTGGGGLAYYNPLTENFRIYEAIPNDERALTDNFVWAVFCDRQGRVWAGTEGALNLFDPKTGRFRHFRHHQTVSGNVRRNAIRAITQTSDGRVWVGTGEGRISHVDERTGELVALPDWAPGAAVKTMTATPNGGLWVASENAGLCHLDLPRNRRTHYRAEPNQPGSLPSNTVNAILVDQQARVWVGTQAGLCLLDPATQRFTRWQHLPNVPHSLPTDKVYSLYQDGSGLLWAGTDQGVASFEPRPSAFEQPLSTSLTGSVWAITEDAQRRLWVGTENNGLLCHDPATGQLTTYRANPADAQALPEDFIRAVCPDRAGRLWVGTRSKGLACLDPATGRFRRFRHNPADPTSLSDDFVRCVYEDRQGRIWVGTEGGLNLLDPVSGRCAVYRHNPRDPQSISSNYVRCVYQDRKGRLWIGVGGGGLSQFDSRTGHCRTFRADRTNAQSLSSNFVRCILEDAQDRLWLGTEGGGLSCLLDADKGTFRSYSEAQGLPNNVVYGMAADESGNLWLATNRGIARFAPRTGYFRTYDMRDGLPQDEHNAGAYWRSPGTGRLYFGGGNGVVAFLPAAVRFNAVPPPVVLTGFRKFNRWATLDTSITASHVLTISPRDNFFSIEFAALNYRLSDKNRFAYKLDNFNEKWIDAGTQRQATYTNLDPGTYVFRVRAANNDGVWNNVGASLRLIVEPPWYQTWWFRILASWLVFGLLFLAYRMRVSQLLALERVRHNIARDLHDDMGSTLSSISILSQLARTHQQRGNAEQSSQLLEQIGDSSRRMLDSMDDIVWAINPAHDSMESVTSRMRSFASDVLEARGIDFTFKVAPEVTEHRLPMRARREFFLLFKEAVNNLAKYSKAELARIGLSYDNRCLVLCVEDDGVGFDPKAPAQGGGNGMTNMRSRAAAIKGQLTIDTAPGQGTRMELRVPLK